MGRIQDITIRSGNNTDYAPAALIHQSATKRFGEGYRGNLLKESVFTDFLHNSSVRIASSGSEIVGYSIAYGIENDLFLYHLFVPVAQGGKGVGNILLEDVFTRAERESKRALTLVTSGSAPWNRPYYEKRGYKILQEKMPTYLHNMQKEDEIFFAPMQKTFPLIWPRVAMERLIP